MASKPCFAVALLGGSRVNEPRHIHARRIVHRDLKSQNIFLSNAGGGGCIVKIGDFGIAKVLQHTRGLAQTLIGTPSNLPPEVCDSKPYGTKADIWSLGVVFYELLTLEPPFKAERPGLGSTERTNLVVAAWPLPSRRLS
ncbi:Serine/threonine-protein kinase Nek5 [Symbiodinium microadriaticum]|uniref:non-specific serine/threonine protein kinase n=1 Tax=Symbiodinium microadriaticum TaxID=2951 RepID=A0A1Q9DT21_SYMMI|nr:Serine/threonine-protein kinase Nek5 [Symbiodinium microadriaticum]